MALSAENIAALAAKFPQSVEQSRKNPGGKITTFIDVDVLEGRLTEVDPGWGKEVQTGSKSVDIHYTVFGVRRGATADLEDTKGGYGSPAKNAEASASRRAMRKFGVGAYLWADEHGDADEDEDERPRKSSKSSKGGDGDFQTLSEAQIKWISKPVSKHGLGVPAALANKIPGGAVGRAFIDALKGFSEDEDDFAEESVAYIKAALKKSVKDSSQRAKLISLLEDGDDEDDED